MSGKGRKKKGADEGAAVADRSGLYFLAHAIPAEDISSNDSDEDAPAPSSASAVSGERRSSGAGAYE